MRRCRLFLRLRLRPLAAAPRPAPASTSGHLALLAWILAVAACAGAPGADRASHPEASVHGQVARDPNLAAVDAPAPAIAPPHVVVLVSLDGFRHDYPARIPTGSFARLSRTGAHAERLVPPFPSQTMVVHATLATGVSPGVHGIVNNRFHDDERGEYDRSGEVAWYRTAPIWVHATRHGVDTRVLQWAGCEGAYEGVSPREARRFDPQLADDAKVDTLIAWAREANGPTLLMSYFAGCDRAGHDHGPASEEVTRCVHETDARIGRLADGVLASGPGRTLVVVSDHGMTETRALLDVGHAVGELGRVFAIGPIAHVYARAPTHASDLERTLRALPHVHVLSRDQAPAAWTARGRTGDFVLTTHPGYVFDEGHRAFVNVVTNQGHHGHEGTHPDMPGIFYAVGRGVRPGAVVAEARSVDVAPTVCRLLGIPAPASAEGAALDDLMVEPQP